MSCGQHLATRWKLPVIGLELFCLDVSCRSRCLSINHSAGTKPTINLESVLIMEKTKDKYNAKQKFRLMEVLSLSITI